MNREEICSSKKIDLLISSLRFFAIILASALCIYIKKLEFSVAVHILFGYALAEFLLLFFFLKNNKQVPHTMLFVLQSGIFSTLILYFKKSPLLDLVFILTITVFMSVFLLLFFPRIYEKNKN
jgi:hypothetical protein